MDKGKRINPSTTKGASVQATDLSRKVETRATSAGLSKLDSRDLTSNDYKHRGANHYTAKVIKRVHKDGAETIDRNYVEKSSGKKMLTRQFYRSNTMKKAGD